MTPGDLLTALALDGGVGLVLFVVFISARASKRFRSRYWVTRLGARQSEHTRARSPLGVRTGGGSGQHVHASGSEDSPLRRVVGEPYDDDGVGPSPSSSGSAGLGGFALLDDAPSLDNSHPADTAPGPIAWLRGVLSVSEEEVRTQALSRSSHATAHPPTAAHYYCYWLWCAYACVCACRTRFVRSAFT